ncbi:MAG TPA: glycosyltransferase family 4 protein [Actinomycetales bacterium]|nr:glycosyltransferase family 4 protein [Actinomycetales bacterium]
MAVVGPTHPFKGGVAAHTTELAHRIAAAGHDVDLVSWSRLYPTLLYPGEQQVPNGDPDVPLFRRTTRRLSWARPDSWLRVGRRLRGYDLVVVVHVVPAVVPAHLVLLRALGRRPGRPRTAAVVHNVLPHEPHPGARGLVRRLLRSVDRVVVHSAEQAQLARRLAPGADVRVAALPPHLPGGEPVQRPPHAGPTRVLCLGIVRDYKGVDLLLEALADVPGPTVTVAGELWGEAGRRVRRLADDARLRGRVTVLEGYVPAARLAPLLASHDVLALPYRSATGSQNALLGRRHGLPVLATRTGSFADEVRDGVDGLLVEPGSAEALRGALQRLVDPALVATLREGVEAPDLDGPWDAYLDALLGSATDSAP